MPSVRKNKYVKAAEAQAKANPAPALTAAEQKAAVAKAYKGSIESANRMNKQMTAYAAKNPVEAKQGFFKKTGNKLSNALWHNRGTASRAGIVAGAVLGTGAAGYYAYRKAKK